MKSLIIFFLVGDKFPSKYFLFSKTSSRRLEDVFSVTIFRFPRRLQDFFKTCLQDVFRRRLQNVLKSLQNVFARSLQNVSKTSSRRFQDVFNTCFYDVFFNTFSKRCLQYFFTKTNVSWGLIQIAFKTARIYLERLWTVY